MRKPSVCVVLPLVVSLILPLPGCTTSHPRERSPSDLIRLLTHQAGQPRDSRRGAAFTCGSLLTEAQKDRGIAARLVKLGAPSLPDIEGALDSVENGGPQSKFFTSSGWLLYAYARIKGPTAYPRLSRMIGKPQLGSLEYSLDVAVAVSLGLTSYVDSLRAPGPAILCRAEEPRDALDRLVLAWLGGDRPAVEASLGPSANAALKSLLKGKTWAEVRADLWPHNCGPMTAAGYRFDVAGRWAEPEETLEGERPQPAVAATAQAPTLDTQFTNHSGVACGNHYVRFLGVSTVPNGPAVNYLVDNSNLADLLSMIASCACGITERR